ncbi:hypothetical protein BJ138DRAFT_1177273 [Hygrophoropsis aurantiaca]|uniref:Uncharacterized protein n=1 Tax=Hygrophoropsis aurantiaca TaxID=72124 RepID=A0ACB8ALX5_9AGAM|nr:hypothetical protein BJ138DRAFT_1177273 [Hygrophoropsis aurantiaca]
MPALRNVRRSRRLSSHDIDGAVDLGWDFEPELLYPSPEPEPEPESVPDVQVDMQSLFNCTLTVDTLSAILSSPSGPSHTRKRKEDHIPRPPNAFMLFRSYICLAEKARGIERDNCRISCDAGKLWKEKLSGAQQIPFRQLAERRKREHAVQYPNYRYSPMHKRTSKSHLSRARRNSKEEVDRCNKLASLVMQGLDGDSLQRVANRMDKEDAKLANKPLHTSPPMSAVSPVSSSHSFPAAPLVIQQTEQTEHRYVNALASTSSPRPIAIPQPLSLTKLIHQRRKNSFLQRRRSGATKKSKSGSKRTIREPSFPPPSHQPFSIKVEELPSPALATPELSYPEPFEDFVPTADIPPLDLDGNHGKIEKKEDDHELLYPVLPRSAAPAYDTCFAIKPEAQEFMTNCMLGTYSYDIGDDMFSPSTPGLSYDLPSGSESGTPPTTPPANYPIFTNPFEKSPFLFDRSALDELFGQSVSPMTVPPNRFPLQPMPIPPVEESTYVEPDLSTWFDFDSLY